MKKLVSIILVLSLLLSASALADIGDRLRVVNCNEYVTLREEPGKSAAALARVPLGGYVDEICGAENGFLCVAYRGKTGYVLSEYLRTAEDYRGSDVSLSKKQRYNLNLFLSNFTEAGFLWRAGCYDESYVDDVALTDFAIDHCWFNRQNKLEWGDYFDGNNVRLPDNQVPPVVEKFFGVSIKPSKSLPYVDYKKGYYYWQETGGHTKDGFACVTRVEKLGRTRYSVWFDIYGMGNDWDNDVCYYTPDQASEDYPSYGYTPYGFAVIDVGSSGLDDRDGWRVERYAMNNEN